MHELMDEIDLLRGVREDVAEPDQTALEPARQRLVARATGGGRRSHRRTPLLAVAAAVVLAVAVGVVVSNPFSTAPATAVGLLHRASDRAQGDLTPGPGQYLAVETREDALGYVDGGRRVIGAYRAVTVSTTYVPHDRDDVWVRRYWTEEPTVFYGGDAVRRAAARDDAVDAHADAPGTERARGGRFGNGELGGGSVGVGTAAIPTLPRDPEALLDVLEASGGEGDTPQVAALQGASTLLRSGLVPLDLRRALFDALALLPDVRVAAGTVTMDGRTGTAVGVEDGGSVWSVVIDPDSGDYLGDLQTQRRAVGAVPAGTVADRTSVRISVVDDAPGR